MGWRVVESSRESGGIESGGIDSRSLVPSWEKESLLWIGPSCPSGIASASWAIASEEREVLQVRCKCVMSVMGYCKCVMQVVVGVVCDKVSYRISAVSHQCPIASIQAHGEWSEEVAEHALGWSAAERCTVPSLFPPLPCAVTLFCPAPYNTHCHRTHPLGTSAGRAGRAGSSAR